MLPKPLFLAAGLVCVMVVPVFSQSLKISRLEDKKTVTQRFHRRLPPKVTLLMSPEKRCGWWDRSSFPTGRVGWNSPAAGQIITIPGLKPTSCDSEGLR